MPKEQKPRKISIPAGSRTKGITSTFQKENKSPLHHPYCVIKDFDLKYDLFGFSRFHIGPMPPPKMGTLKYEVPKVAILRSMARIGSFRRSPPKLCTIHPPPTPENNPLPLAPAKSSNLLSVAHISPILWHRIIALIILIILTPDITSFGHSKPSQQVQQVKKGFFVSLELKPPDHSGDVTQFGKNCLRLEFLSYCTTALLLTGGYRGLLPGRRAPPPQDVSLHQKAAPWQFLRTRRTCLSPGAPTLVGNLSGRIMISFGMITRVFHDWLFEPQLMPQLRLLLDIKLGQEIKLGSELDVKLCIGPQLDIQLCPNLCLNLAST
ncbi:hypothetical protein C8J57DRAFT_1238225 [Mycena rebaudengoi]|nr:hypothetical protein C8J57DRAFT_1238225 [Mycena rebaudengoi]